MECASATITLSFAIVTTDGNTYSLRWLLSSRYVSWVKKPAWQVAFPIDRAMQFRVSGMRNRPCSVG